MKRRILTIGSDPDAHYHQTTCVAQGTLEIQKMVLEHESRMQAGDAMKDHDVMCPVEQGIQMIQQSADVVSFSALPTHDTARRATAVNFRIEASNRRSH